MLISEMAKDIEVLQARTLALEFLIQIMLKNMPDSERKLLHEGIQAALTTKQSDTSLSEEIIIHAASIIQSHLQN